MLASVPRLGMPSICSLEALFAGCPPVLGAETYQNTVGEATSGLPAMRRVLSAINGRLPATGVL